MSEALIGFVAGLGALLAVGCGVSVGWVLHARYVRANPTGVESVARMAAQQVAAIERNCQERVRAVEEAHLGVTATLQRAVQELSFAAARPGVAEGPAPLPRSIPVEDSAARATGRPVSERTAQRDMLLAGGLDAASADAILDGRMDDLPPDTVLGQVQDRMVAEATRLP